MPTERPRTVGPPIKKSSAIGRTLGQASAVQPRSLTFVLERAIRADGQTPEWAQPSS